jgi:hypothetical protein
MHLVMWDTSGQERFRSIILPYLKDALVVIVVIKCDKGVPDFEHRENWLTEIKTQCPDARVIFAMNQFGDPKWEPDEEFEEMTERIKLDGVKFIGYFKINTANGDGCQNLFEKVIECALGQSLKPRKPFESPDFSSAGTSPATEEESLGGSHPLFWPGIAGSAMGTSPAAEEKSRGGSHPLFWPGIAWSAILISAVFFSIFKRSPRQTTQRNPLPHAKAQKFASRSLELVTQD